jgi:hypothetical protein
MLIFDEDCTAGKFHDLGRLPMKGLESLDLSILQKMDASFSNVDLMSLTVVHDIATYWKVNKRKRELLWPSSTYGSPSPSQFGKLFPR